MAKFNILLTRDKKDNQVFKLKLEKIGAKVYILPCIEIVKNNLTGKIQEELKNIKKFDWIFFTSANGVLFFQDYLKSRGENLNVLKNKKIGVVGPETAKVLKKHKLKVALMPSQYLTLKIAEEIGKVKNLYILLLRSKIANHALALALKRKGAKLTNIPIYKTEFLNKKNDFFEKLTGNINLDYITFTSSSTVNGFLKRVTLKKLRQKAYDIKVLAIGPVTAQTARQAGFKNIITADEFSTDGMINKLVELG